MATPDCSRDAQPWITALDHDTLLATFCLLDADDLRQLRLVSKDFYACATAAVRALRPAAAGRLGAFPALCALDATAVEDWHEDCLAEPSVAARLTSLKLGRRNPLSPAGADAVAALRSLRSLELLESRVADAALLRWTSLTGLTSLALRDCAHLTDEGLAALAQLRGLQEVELGSCSKVGDATLRALGTLPALRKVDLAACDRFSGDGLRALAAAGSVRTLLLPAAWQLDDDALAAAATAMPQLECLGLFEAGESVSDDGLLALSSLSKLTALDLGYSCWGHTPGGLERLIRSLPGLQMLNLGGAEGTCNAVVGACGDALKGLTMLDVSECQRLGPSGIKQLAKLPRLAELNLGWNLRLADAHLGGLPPSLTKLDLSFCAELGDGAMAVAAALPVLSVLVLRKCARVGDRGAAALAGCPALRVLDLSYTGVTSRGVRHLATLPALEQLTLVGCPRAATVLGLGALEGCASLRHLDVSDNKRLDNGCMQAVSFVPQLRHLELRACPRVTDHGVLALLRIRRLLSLNVDGCHGVSAMALSALQRQLPRLRSVRRPGADGAPTPLGPSWGTVHPVTGRLL